MAAKGTERMVSGGLTQAEIIAIALEKLQIRSGETLVDIGCGTDSVSIAASKKARSLFSKILDAKSNRCLLDGSQPRQTGSHFSSASSFAI